jgi:hypothetical protein
MSEATAEEDDGDEEEEDEVGMQKVSFPYVVGLLGNLHLERTPKILRNALL